MLARTPTRTVVRLSPPVKQVVDSICTLGPIVDAALVPSAYHVPKTVAVAGTGGSRSKGRRGGQGAKTRAAAAAAAAAGGGGTSGGGIRTSLVCAAGYGQQGSLAVFSAGLRTEVNRDGFATRVV